MCGSMFHVEHFSAASPHCSTWNIEKAPEETPGQISQKSGQTFCRPKGTNSKGANWAMMVAAGRGREHCIKREERLPFQL